MNNYILGVDLVCQLHVLRMDLTSPDVCFFVFLVDIKKTSLEETSNIAIDFWEQVAKQLPEWSRVQKNDLLASEVRTDYIHSHGIFLTSIARVGNYLLNHKKSKDLPH